jgi:SAM-dependent methyltransferase
VKRDEWNLRWQENDLQVHDDPIAVDTAELASIPPGRALDLACGHGRHAVWLAEHGWRITAIDFSDVALRLAREHADERGVDVDWVLADIRSYEPEPDAFDLVLVTYLHVPVDERRPVLARGSRALVAGGTMVVLGHDRDNIGTGAPGPSSNPDVLYTSEEIAADLDRLEITTARQVRRMVETENGWVEAVDTLVVGRRTVG